MTRKVENNTKYLQRQVYAFTAAQEQVFPDKRDLRDALGCTPAMFYNYQKGKAVLLNPYLYNRMIERPELVPFVQAYQTHLWSL